MKEKKHPKTVKKNLKKAFESYYHNKILDAHPSYLIALASDYQF